MISHSCARALKSCLQVPLTSKQGNTMSVAAPSCIVLQVVCLRCSVVTTLQLVSLGHLPRAKSGVCCHRAKLSLPPPHMAWFLCDTGGDLPNSENEQEGEGQSDPILCGFGRHACKQEAVIEAYLAKHRLLEPKCLPVPQRCRWDAMCSSAGMIS